MRRIILTLAFLLAAIAALLASPRTVSAGCPPECDYVRQSCTGCVASTGGCYKLCRDVYYCITASCSGHYTYSSYYRVSCSLPYECTECDCSGRKECSDPCSYDSYITGCAKPAGCATPSPTPTSTAGYCDPDLSDCGDGQDVCGDEAGEGDTCIHLINSNICKCTSEQPTETYVCEPYRPYQVVDGVCYQQWECCLPGTTTCFYQIRQTCEGVASPTPTATATPTPSPTPSCSVSLSPSSASVVAGGYVSFRASVAPANGAVARVDFSAASSLASVAPLSDGTVPYDVSARGISAGTTGVVAGVVMAGAVRCSAASTLTVAEPGPWWRVRDGDVAANGSLASLIPFGCSLPACDPTFGLDGDGGYPGIPGFVGTMGLGSGSVSSTGWSAESAPGSRKTYSYSYFVRQIPSDVEITAIASSAIEGSLFESGGALSHGAYWYRYDGSSGLDLSISSNANLGSRKVVLLVDGADLYLNGRTSLAKGEGFFAAIVGSDSDGNGGNIFINASVGGAADGVPELEGLFVADSEVLTGSGNMQLHVRGSVAGLSGIVLQRDLDDDSRTPAELFEYAPDLIMNVPSSLRTSGYSWREVAP